MTIQQKLLYIIHKNIECIPDLISGDYNAIKKYDTKEFRNENKKKYEIIKTRGEEIYLCNLSILLPCIDKNEIGEVLAKYFYNELFGFLTDTKIINLVKMIKCIPDLLYVTDDNGDYLPHKYFKKDMLLDFLDNIIFLSDDYINIKNNNKDTVLHMIIKQDVINENLIYKLLEIGANILLTDNDDKNIIDLIDDKISKDLKKEILKKQPLFLREEIKCLKESNNLLINKLNSIVKIIQAFDINMLKKLSVVDKDFEFDQF